MFSFSPQKTQPTTSDQFIDNMSWYWNVYDNHWVKFDPEINSKLESATESKIDVYIRGKLYEIDFDKKIQTNKETNFVRRIIRRNVNLKRRFPIKYSKKLSFSSKDTIDWKSYTKWKIAKKNEYDPDDTDPITMEEFKSGNVVELSCCPGGTQMLQSSIEQCLNTDSKCPMCSQFFKAPGPQPKGTMEIVEREISCKGSEDCATIIINYKFDDGIQTKRMKRPGLRYSGTSRTVFIPSNDDAEEIVNLLQKAFINGYLFMVGDSVTTGEENTVIWRIHQKTSLSGGAQKHGYPDPGYLQRLKSECSAYGLLDLE